MQKSLRIRCSFPIQIRSCYFREICLWELFSIRLRSRIWIILFAVLAGAHQTTLHICMQSTAGWTDCWSDFQQIISGKCKFLPTAYLPLIPLHRTRLRLGGSSWLIMICKFIALRLFFQSCFDIGRSVQSERGDWDKCASAWYLLYWDDSVGFFTGILPKGLSSKMSRWEE